MMTIPISKILQLYTGNDDNPNEQNIAALHWQWWQPQWAKYNAALTLTMMTTPMSEILQPYTDNDDNSNERNILEQNVRQQNNRETKQLNMYDSVSPQKTYNQSFSKNCLSQLNKDIKDHFLLLQLITLSFIRFIT